MQVDSSKRPCLAARVALVTVALGTAACGVEFEGPIQGEEVSVQEDALGEATCATVDATEQYVYGITPARTSARSYTTAGCYKAEILDIFLYSPQYLGDSVVDGGTYVTWADTLPLNQQECESLWLRVDQYQRPLAGEWQLIQTKRARGEWSYQPPASSCRMRHVSFHEGELEPFGLYRFVISARTDPSSSAPTRKYTIQSMRPIP